MGWKKTPLFVRAVVIILLSPRNHASSHALVLFLQLAGWLSELKQELGSEEVSDSLEGAERLLEQFSTQRDSTLDACASTLAEGKTLLEELKANGVSLDMDSTGSMAAVQATLERLSGQRDELGELWSTRKMRLDLCLQLRLFERDALEVRLSFR